MNELTRLTTLVAEHVFIKKARHFIRISKNDIRYIKVNGKYCHIICDRDKFLVQMPMKKLLEKLTGCDFVRIHRNFIINMNSVKRLSMNENYIELLDGTSLPFSRESKRDFFNQFHLLS